MASALGLTANRVGWRLLAAAAVLSVLAAHARYFYPFFSDDALISLRYAVRLCEGKGLTWTDGVPVEGYTDLLWVLLNAPAACVGLDPMLSARALDFVGASIAALVIATPLSGRSFLAPGRLLSGSLLFVASAPVAAWAVGGLEHGFMTGVLALGLHWGRMPPTARSTWLASACFGALALLRADGAVLFAGATLGRLLASDTRTGGMRAALVWISVPAVLLCCQLAFRIGYYGELVPNTAVAKVSFNAHRLLQGLEHLRVGLASLTALWVPALAGVWISWKAGHRGAVLVPAATALTWTAYLASVGGDIFPAWRQLLLALVPLALLAADGAEISFARAGRVRGVALTGACCAWVAVHVHLQQRDAENRRAKAELWEWDGKPIGETLGRAFGEQAPLLAVDAAGALPYWSGLPALDMLGLNDHYIPRHPPPHFGRGAIGHELGDAGYVWSRRPDLIAFCGARGNRDPCFLSGRGLVNHPQFHSKYRRVRVQGGQAGPIGDIWFRIEESSIGVDRHSDRIVIPGHLFGKEPAVARLGPSGRLEAALAPEQPGRLRALTVPAGVWTLSAEPSLDGVTFAFACDGVSPTLLEGNPKVLRLRRTTQLDIGLRVDGVPFSLRTLTLQRTPKSEPPGVECALDASRRPVVRSLTELAHAFPEGADWAMPGVTRIGTAGLRVEFGKPLYPVGLELSADNNDEYRVDLYSGGDRKAAITVPRVSATGLRTRHVGVPFEVTRDGVDAMRIRPGGGDASYSVGHVRIME